MTKKKNNKNLSISQQALADFMFKERREADQTGNIVYQARAMVQATMPHSKQDELIHFRTNGNFSIQLNASQKYGLPFGSYPRIIMAHITTMAVKQRTRFIVLPDTITGFMNDLGIANHTGGKNGSITALRDQINRLTTTSIVCIYEDDERMATRRPDIFTESDIWWNTKKPEQTASFASYVELGEAFYNEVQKSPVPVDIRALWYLRRSPMAIDIYQWLTHRMSYLRKETVIPWEGLQFQIGGNYTELRNFKAAFINGLTKVVEIYPEAKVYLEDNGLRLKPSPTHVKSKLIRGA